MKLADLAMCFHGVVPSKIATCALDGTPNAAYLSHVYLVDDNHVASSFQFFNKTRKNLMENPYAVIELRDPLTLHRYLLKVKYLRSEESGPTYEKMSLKLDVIAAYEGMGGIFRLRAADIYQVEEIQDLGTHFANNFESPKPNTAPCLDDLEIVRVISDQLGRIQNLEELLDESMKALGRSLGWQNMILLLLDKSSQTLVTHATYGYKNGGVGSEVPWDHGLIGACARHRRHLQISGMKEAFRYSQAMIRSLEESKIASKIPLPGLKNPASQMAAPILSQDELLGVLMVESETKDFWDCRDQIFVSLVTNILGMGLRGLGSSEAAISPGEVATAEPTPSQVWTYRFAAADEMMFVNDQYLIRNIPAKILKYLLEVHLKTHRKDFSNLELRPAKELCLPDVKDNLETRLILLRKRLDENKFGVRLRSTGRGKFSIDVTGTVSLVIS